MKKSALTALALAAVLLAGCASGSGSVESSSSSSSGTADVSSAPEPVQGDPAFGVQVDWSRLEGERPAVQPDVDGGRWYPEHTDRLIPGEEYGPLVPYLGEVAYPFQRWGDETGDAPAYWEGWASSFYGLMTREGKIVVDPVYQSVNPYSFLWQGEYSALPVLLLARSDPAWEENSGLRYAVAAEDGRWSTEFEFINYTNKGDQLLLLRPQGVTQLDSANGTRKDWSWAELGVSEDEVPDMLGNIQWGMGWTWTDHGVFLSWELPEEGTHSVPENTLAVRIFQPETGEVFWTDSGQWDSWCDEYLDQRWGAEWEMTQEGDQVTLSWNGETYVISNAPPNCYLYLPQVKNGMVVLESEGGCQLRRLSDGASLLEGKYIQFISDAARPESSGCVSVLQGDTIYTLFGPDLTPILTLTKSKADTWLQLQLRDGLLSCWVEGTWFGCWDLEAGRYIFYRSLGLGD